METYQVEGLQVVHSPPSEGRPSKAFPLLLVHGASHGAWCWELWQQRLPQLGWGSHALSLRNHPGSYSVDEETYRLKTTVAEYADDVAAVARHIGEPCVVVAHSMGGMVAQCFVAAALAEGLPVAGLVLMASTAPAQLGRFVAAPFPTDRPFLFDRETTIQRYFHNIPAERLERALDRLVPESTAVINQILASPGVALEASRITCPVLSVTAEHDHTSVPRERSLADYYGGDYLHDEQNGHDLMLEAGWEPLMERILEWVVRRVAIP